MTDDITNPSKRLLWIDYARFMSLFLVTAYHVPVTLPEYPRYTFFLLQLPSFVFISGLLFRFDKYSGFKDYITHRAKQLLIPYFSFVFIFYILWLIKVLTKAGDPSIPIWQPIWEGLMGRPSTVCGPLWFVACLFTLQSLFYLIFKWIKNRWLSIGILTILSLSFAFAYNSLRDIPWVLDSALAYLPFYGIAVFFRKEILELMNKRIRFVIAIGCLIIHGAALYCIMNLNFSDFTGNIVRITGSFSIIFPYCVLLKSLTGIIKERWIISQISSNGVVVLACHISVISIILHLTGLTPESMSENYLLKYAIATVTIVSMLIPIYFINRYTPFILGKGLKNKSR